VVGGILLQYIKSNYEELQKLFLKRYPDFQNNYARARVSGWRIPLPPLCTYCALNRKEQGVTTPTTLPPVH
jgi:hypothetical protein